MFLLLFAPEHSKNKKDDKPCFIVFLARFSLFFFHVVFLSFCPFLFSLLLCFQVKWAEEGRERNNKQNKERKEEGKTKKTKKKKKKLN